MRRHELAASENLYEIGIGDDAVEPRGGGVDMSHIEIYPPRGRGVPLRSLAAAKFRLSLTRS